MNAEVTRAEEWSLRTWLRRHEEGYFPNSEQHAGWRIYDEPPPWLLPHLGPEAVVLEVGCGYGQWMMPVAGRVRHVTGVDIHRVLVDKATAVFAERGVCNAAVMQCDGLGLPFTSAWAFDVVYSVSVMQHLPRSIVRRYLAESARVLRPGGTCLHHLRNLDDVGPYPRPADDIEEDHRGDFSVGWTAAQALEAGQAAGLATTVVNLGLHLVLVGRKPT